MLEELNRVTVHCAHRDDPIDACYVIRHSSSQFALVGELVEITDSAKDLLFKSKSESNHDALHKRAKHDLTYFVGNQHYRGIDIDPSDFIFNNTLLNENVIQEIDHVMVDKGGDEGHMKIFHLSTYKSASKARLFDTYFVEDPHIRAGTIVAQGMNSDHSY